MSSVLNQESGGRGVKEATSTDKKAIRDAHMRVQYFDLFPAHAGRDPAHALNAAAAKICFPYEAGAVLRGGEPPEKSLRSLVSVIVPVYKVEEYLKNCLDSILAQSYRNLEIILVDDGSPDRCGSICDEYAASDGRIHVIHQENKGLSMARNAGIRACHGEYILFVDSDDWIEPDTVETMLSALLENDCDVCCCGYVAETAGKRLEYPVAEELTLYEGREDIISAFSSGDFKSYAWNKLWKRELFDDTEFPPGRTFEDIATVWKLFLDCDRVVSIPDCSFHYTIRPGSISSTKTMKTLYDFWLACKERFEGVYGINDEIDRKCVMQRLSSIAYVCRWLHCVGRKERRKHETMVKEMQAFTLAHKERIKECGLATRVGLFTAAHPTGFAFFASYSLNMIYRKIVRKTKKS